MDSSLPSQVRAHVGSYPRPSARLAALLGAVLVGLFSVVGMPSTAAAAPADECSCQSGNFTQLLKRADTVMVASVEHVRLTEEATATSEATTTDEPDTMRVVARRVFKGEVEQARVEVTSTNVEPCTWYDSDNDERLLVVVRDGHADACTGSRPATTRVVQRVQRQLGSGEKIAPPPPREATRTKIEGTEPLDFGRLAAPGGAMVLVGLLGLAVVSRLNRT